MSTEMRFGHSDECEPLHYPECGLPDVYLLSGYRWETDEEGEQVLAVEDVDGLLRAIGVDLALHRKVLSGREIKFLRKQMCLTQDEMGQWLRSTGQLVARWERGETNIKGAADALLRLFYLDNVGYMSERMLEDEGHQVTRALELLRRYDDVDQSSKRLFGTDDDGSWHMKAA